MGEGVIKMTQVQLTNGGGTLNCDAIAHRESQACKIPIRSVPTRTTGAFVDTGTYTLKNRKLFMAIRLTDAEKTTLDGIFDQRALVTITMKIGPAAFPKWEYNAWFVKKPIIYEWSTAVSGTDREWLAECEFVCDDDFGYDVAYQEGFEGTVTFKTANYLVPCDPLGAVMNTTTNCKRSGNRSGQGALTTGGYAADFDFTGATSVIITLYYSQCGLLGGTDFGYCKVRDCDAGTWLYNQAIGTTASGDSAWHLFTLDITANAAGLSNVRIFILAEVGSVRQHVDDIQVTYV